MNKVKFLGLALSIFSFGAYAQNVTDKIDEAEQLRYELSKVRENFDVLYYDLDIEVQPASKSIKGSNTVQFTAVDDINEIQLDLFENMNVSAVKQDDKTLKFERKHNAIFINLDKTVKKGENTEVTVFYSGTPIEAKKAPWDGGFVWSKDENGKPWVGVAVEGIGASAWWPNKDHLSDEPDNGIQVSLTVPKDLMGVSNGKFISEADASATTKKYVWRTSYPIDNYNVTLYVGDYVNYSEYYESAPERNAYGIPVSRVGEQTEVNYYVLKDNLEQAKEHFTFTEDVMQALEFAFGPYPFKKDGLKYVEAPYLGMEHQGAIAYGNGYQTGWRGEQVKPYLEFDYLFVHETAHEWWGNNVSVDDRAAMWIQEAFATYADAWYVYTTYGYKGYRDYMKHYKTLVQNEMPILGNYNRSNEGKDTDMYYKGALMLNTLAQLVEDNELWFNTLKKAQEQFAAPKTVSHDEFIAFLQQEFRMDLTNLFKQYLETTEIPTIVYGIKEQNGKSYLLYKWVNVVEGFDMPIKLKTDQYKSQWIYPTENWKKIQLPKKINKKYLEIDDENFYIDAKRIDKK